MFVERNVKNSPTCIVRFRAFFEQFYGCGMTRQGDCISPSTSVSAVNVKAVYSLTNTHPILPSKSLGKYHGILKPAEG